MAFLFHYCQATAPVLGRHCHMFRDCHSSWDEPTTSIWRHARLNTDADYFQLNRYRKICIYNNIDKGKRAYFFRKNKHSLFKNDLQQSDFSTVHVNVIKTYQTKKDFSINFPWHKVKYTCVHSWTPFLFFQASSFAGKSTIVPITYYFIF